MSTACRIEAAKLRRKYAKNFNVALELVEVEERPDDDAQVWCPTRADLPKWTTGRIVSNG